MLQKIITAFKYSFFLALGIFLTYWQYSKMTVEQKQFFASSIQNTNYFYLLPVLFLAISSHICRSIRWQYLIKPLGFTPKLQYTFATVMIGYLVNSLVPRAGEIAKCTLLGKKEKIPVDKLIGTILVERAIDLLCYAAVIIITILLQYQRIKIFMASLYHKAVDDGGMNPLVKIGLYLLGIVTIIYCINYLAKRYSNNLVLRKIKGLLNGVKDGFNTIKLLENKKQFWLQTALIWFCYLMQIYIGFKAMQFTAELGIDAAFAVLSLGTLAMIVTPGGIGSFPYAVAQVILLYNISEIAAESFGWVMWGATTTIIVVIGLFSFLWFLYHTNKKKTTYNE